MKKLIKHIPVFLATLESSPKNFTVTFLQSGFFNWRDLTLELHLFQHPLVSPVSAGHKVFISDLSCLIKYDLGKLSDMSQFMVKGIGNIKPVKEVKNFFQLFFR